MLEGGAVLEGGPWDVSKKSEAVARVERRAGAMAATVEVELEAEVEGRWEVSGSF